MFVRRLRSKVGNIQVQVVEKVNGNNRVVKHIGTARNDLEQITLEQQAQQYIDGVRIDKGQISLFDNRYTQSDLHRFFSQVKIMGVLVTPTYQVLEYFYNLVGFSHLNDVCFKDLVIARLARPGSKVATRNWLDRKLNKKYSLTAIYRHMRQIFDLQYQSQVEDLIFQYLSQQTSTVISVLFFDVTTLYYEAFDEDDLRKCGFSKDRKNNQPQLVVALTVNRQGFPLQLNVFPGNKFEGHTFIPCMKQLIAKHQLKQFVVVADSAMISVTNMAALERERIDFIVGARLGNLKQTLFDKIVATIPKVDGATKRFTFNQNQILVVSYSTKRANKDRADRNKQLKRAEHALHSPSAIVNRYKYLQKAQVPTKGSTWKINQEKVIKSTQLEGLKGYVTNATNLTDKEIIEKYASLWQVEQSFRISKSDLKARPIFHTTQDKIEAHLAIVFTALAVAKLIEQTTHQSIRQTIELLEDIHEIKFEDPVSGEALSLYTKTTNPTMKKLLTYAKCLQAVG
ncbi:MAG: IS1634 family transposase [Patescibacteria group bacterium]